MVGDKINEVLLQAFLPVSDTVSSNIRKVENQPKRKIGGRGIYGVSPSIKQLAVPALKYDRALFN